MKRADRVKADLAGAARRLVAQRVKQGLRRTCTDPSTIARIASILREADVPKKKGRSPSGPAEVVPSLARPRASSQQTSQHRGGHSNEPTRRRARSRT